MKKNKPDRITPEEAVQFLDEFRKLSFQIDEPTKAISIRIPENLIRALKIKARYEGKKYQSLMIEILRKGL